MAIRDPWRLFAMAVAGLVGLIVLAMAIGPAVQAADQPVDHGSPVPAQDNDDNDDDGIFDDEDDDAVTDDDDNGITDDDDAMVDDDDAVVDDDDDAVVDDDETPGPAETGNAGVLGGAAGGQDAVPQQQDDNDDNGITDDDNGITDDDNGITDDDAVTDDAMVDDDDAMTDDEVTPAPADTGSGGLVGAGGAGTSAGLFLLLAGGALALLTGARFAMTRR